jgi:hypothetical protein
MTRAPSDNTRTAKIVLNVTKQGERERKNHTTNISRPRKERERERYIFLVPSVCRLEAGASWSSATRWSYLRWVGGCRVSFYRYDM